MRQHGRRHVFPAFEAGLRSGYADPAADWRSFVVFPAFEAGLRSGDKDLRSLVSAAACLPGLRGRAP